MIKRSLAFTAFMIVAIGCVTAAENKMSYQLETPEQASTLSKAGGSLGMRVGPEHQITSEGLTFEILKVESVGPGSPAAQAGLKVGDQIIAVNRHVFPNTAVFATYVGSANPGQRIEIDYMPAGGGPQQAQRVGVMVGEAGRTVPTRPSAPASTGLTTGDKVAIGVGAAAIFGCYEFNCYARIKNKIQDQREKQGQPATTAEPRP